MDSISDSRNLSDNDKLSSPRGALSPEHHCGDNDKRIDSKTDLDQTQELLSTSAIHEKPGVIRLVSVEDNNAEILTQLLSEGDENKVNVTADVPGSVLGKGRDSKSKNCINFPYYGSRCT